MVEVEVGVEVVVEVEVVVVKRGEKHRGAKDTII